MHGGRIRVAYSSYLPDLSFLSRACAQNEGAGNETSNEAARSLGYQTLKDHQILVLSSFVKGNDVFGYAHARVDNDIHSISQFTPRTLLRHHTFHGHT